MTPACCHLRRFVVHYPHIWASVLTTTAQASPCWSSWHSPPPPTAYTFSPYAAWPCPMPKRKRGGQPGNDNARRHGYYATPAHKIESIGDIITDLAARMEQLSGIIDQAIDEGAHLPELATLFSLHAQTASRLGRLLRDQRALSGIAADTLAGAIAMALDEIATEREALPEPA